MKKLIVIDPASHTIVEKEVDDSWVHNLKEITGSECFDCICSAGYIKLDNVWFPVYVEDSGLYKYPDMFAHSGYPDALAGPGIIAPRDEGDLIPGSGYVTPAQAKVMPRLDLAINEVIFLTTKSSRIDARPARPSRRR